MPKATKNSSTQMAKHLANVVSDTYLLMIKTHGYHWNVTGPQFRSLHLMFEEQYNELFAAVDLVAERIRALDEFAPGSAQTFHMHTSIKEASGAPPAAKAMLSDLIKSNEQIRTRIEDARAFADEVGDKASEDLLIARLEVHDKAIWMLKSTAA